MLKKNQIIKLIITGINSEGCGVGRYNGIAVFVPFTYTDEEIECRVEKVAKNYCHARVTEIINPSLERIPPNCPHFYRCGGCAYRHITYEAETTAKLAIVNDAFLRIGKIDTTVEEIIPSPQTQRYRNKAQFVVRDVGGKAVTGFFAPRSHRFIEIENCLLQPELFSAVAKKCCEYFNINKISCYNEDDFTGEIRHILLRYSDSSGELMVCIVSRKKIDLSPLAELLSESFENPITLLLNINSRQTNVILGNKTQIYSGKGYIKQRLFDVDYEISAHSFFQVNTAGAHKLYEVVKEFAEPNKDDVILDLYCGVGSIGLSIVEKHQSLLGVDIVEAAIIAARNNAKRFGYKNATFITGNAHTGLEQQVQVADIVIVDPPRKGLDDKTIDLLLKNSPKKIVMVSCNPSTAARDVSILSSKYDVNRIVAVDMFARCAHVETCVLLSHKDPQNCSPSK